MRQIKNRANLRDNGRGHAPKKVPLKKGLKNMSDIFFEICALYFKICPMYFFSSPT